VLAWAWGESAGFDPLERFLRVDGARFRKHAIDCGDDPCGGIGGVGGHRAIQSLPLPRVKDFLQDLLLIDQASARVSRGRGPRAYAGIRGASDLARESISGRRGKMSDLSLLSRSSGLGGLVSSTVFLSFVHGGIKVPEPPAAWGVVHTIHTSTSTNFVSRGICQSKVPGFFSDPLFCELSGLSYFRLPSC
jgi:hypothetical protein